jgi:hypothetical protein
VKFSLIVTVLVFFLVDGAHAQGGGGGVVLVQFGLLHMQI